MVERGTTTIAEMATSIQEVFHGMIEIQEVSENISESSLEQSKGIAELLAAILEIEKGAVTVETQGQSLQSSIQVFADQTSYLKKVLEGFSLLESKADELPPDLFKNLQLNKETAQALISWLKETYKGRYSVTTVSNSFGGNMEPAILVIDDSSFVHAYIRSLMTLKGYRVLSAYDWPEVRIFK